MNLNMKKCKDCGVSNPDHAICCRWCLSYKLKQENFKSKEDIYKMEEKEIDKIKYRQEEIMELIDTLNDQIEKLLDEANELMYRQLELDDKYIEIECLRCSGHGWTKLQDGGKKIICPSCNGKCFIWAKKYNK